MKKFKSHIFSYVTIVIIPFIIISLILYKYNKELNKKESYNRANWVASIYQREMNHLLIETKTLMETLASTYQCTKSVGIDKTLKTLQSKDPRYIGFYCISPDGNILAKSNDLLPIHSFKDYKFFQRIFIEKKTALSQQEVILNDHKEAIAIATPILNDQGQKEVLHVLITYLNTNYIKNMMKILTPNEHVQITNMRGDIILDTEDYHLHDVHNVQWVEIPIELLPWSMKIKIKESSRIVMPYFHILLIEGIAFVTLNLLFFLKQYFLLRRKAKKELEQRDKEKLKLIGTLASSTAHEIRNPLTGIKGLIQLLSEKHENEEDQFYFSVINKEIQRINQIVSDFLILGKPTVQKVKPIHLGKVINEVRPIIETEAHIYNVECNWEMIDQDIYINGISDQIKQILFNITKNALEAMKDGGKLTIRLEACKNNAIIKVIDTGIGMNQEELLKIFEPFYTSKNDGTGLGLVICKKIIESFGGKIDISSTVNKGTTVIITLPIMKNS